MTFSSIENLSIVLILRIILTSTFDAPSKSYSHHNDSLNDSNSHCVQLLLIYFYFSPHIIIQIYYIMIPHCISTWYNKNIRQNSMSIIFQIYPIFESGRFTDPLY